MKYSLFLLFLWGIKAFSQEVDKDVFFLALLPKDILDSGILPYLIIDKKKKENDNDLGNQLISSIEQTTLALDLLPKEEKFARLHFDVLTAVFSSNKSYVGVLQKLLNEKTCINIVECNALKDIVYEKQFNDDSCCAMCIDSMGKYYIQCIENNQQYLIRMFDIKSNEPKAKTIKSIKKHSNQKLCQESKPSMGLNDEEDQLFIKIPGSSECISILHQEKTFNQLLMEKNFMHDKKLSKPTTLEELFYRMGISKKLINKG